MAIRPAIEVQQGALRVSGERAEDFLQGLLSCDIGECSNERAQPGALLSVDGRVLSTLLLVHPEPGRWLLLLPIAQLDRVYDDLARPAALYRGMQLEREPLRQIGSDSPADTIDSKAPPGDWGQVCEDGKVAIRYPGEIPRWLLLDGTEGAGQLNRAPAAEATIGDWWTVADIDAGHYPVLDGMEGRLTAHNLHLQLNGRLSFAKGCYRGQEIVARTQYRGRVKRVLAALHCEQQPSRGMRVSSAPGKALGEILTVAGEDDNWRALLQVPVELLDDPGVLEVDGQVVRLVPPPYWPGH